MQSVRPIYFAALGCLLLHGTRAVAQSAPSASPSASAAPAAAPPARPNERLSDEGELQRIIGLYDAGKYEECARDLSKLLDPQSAHPLEKRPIRETARVYHAACLIGIGEFEKADKPLSDAIRENKQMEQPDALIFPRPVVERFLRVRQSMLEEIRRAEQQQLEEAKRRVMDERKKQQAQARRNQMLEELAGREVVITQNRRWIAAIPFGVGQFQNSEKNLGYFFLVSEALALGASLTSFAISTHIDSQAAQIEASGQESDANTRAQDWHMAGRITSYTFLSLAAIGITEAQLSFVPEFRSVRRRPLPPPIAGVKATPSVAITSQGLSLGLSGKF